MNRDPQWIRNSISRLAHAVPIDTIDIEHVMDLSHRIELSGHTNYGLYAKWINGGLNLRFRFLRCPSGERARGILGHYGFDVPKESVVGNTKLEDALNAIYWCGTQEKGTDIVWENMFCYLLRGTHSLLISEGIGFRKMKLDTEST